MIYQEVTVPPVIKADGSAEPRRAARQEMSDVRTY